VTFECLILNIKCLHFLEYDTFVPCSRFVSAVLLTHFCTVKSKSKAIPVAGREERVWSLERESSRKMQEMNIFIICTLPLIFCSMISHEV
jgi:hypothetical protein